MQIEVGDYITFKAATRAGCRKARRKVVEIGLHYLMVKYHGWDNFAVDPSEVIKVEKKDE